jgi:hypothetical protein
MNDALPSWLPVDASESAPSTRDLLFTLSNARGAAAELRDQIEIPVNEGGAGGEAD